MAFNMDDKKTHSYIGASSAERWMSCPRSVALCEYAPETPPSKYAEEGTRAHHVAELALRGDKAAVNALRSDPQYTPEMFIHAQEYREFVLACNRGGKILIEQPLSLTCYDERAYGTSDACVVNETELLAIDYKYGAGYAVDVTDNPQLRFYALGALFSLTEKEQEKIESIQMAIFQPRILHIAGPARVALMSKAELVEWGEKVLKPAMALTKDPDAPLAIGPWCRWCPAITLCPNQGKLPIKVSPHIDFAEDPSFNDKIPAPKNLSLEQIGIALEARDQIEAWFEQVEILARQALNEGKEVPGWKLVQGRKTKSWADEAAAEEILSLAYGDDAFTKKLLSPAAAIKLGIEAPSMVVETIGNPSLVRASDKRECVKRSAITDFKES